jgi:hypothetical protein
MDAERLTPFLGLGESQAGRVVLVVAREVWDAAVKYAAKAHYLTTDKLTRQLSGEL